jgi:hypothetical protein
VLPGLNLREVWLMSFESHAVIDFSICSFCACLMKIRMLKIWCNLS